jgi:hypothetical protein
MAAVYVLKSDNGTHSADAWADMFATILFPISDEIAQHRILPAKNAQLAIANALAVHAQAILDNEHNLLGSDADKRFAETHDGEKFVDGAVADVLKATDKSPWADHVRQNEKQLRLDLAMHFSSMQNVERMYYSDHHPSDAGDAYKAKHHGTGV